MFWTDQEQPEAAWTVTVAVPPFFGTVTSSGLTVNVHGAANWLTVSVRPATVSVPERGEGFGFGATV
jgi:hypothetical protein